MLQEATELSGELTQRTTSEAPQRRYGVHRTGHSQEDDQLLRKGRSWLCAPEGKIGSSRREFDAWIRTPPQPRMMAMEATIFTGWIYDYLLPHAEKVKVKVHTR